MWKIAIAVMLLATSAFGAVTMTLGPVDTTGQAIVNAAGDVTLTVHLNLDAGQKAASYSLYALAPDQTVQITGRSFLNVMTDPQDGALVGKFLEGNGVVDMGAGAPAGTTITTSQDLETLTFHVPAALTAPVSVDFYPFPAVDGSSMELAPQTVIFTVPEPASMLLLAVGAAFFARRRRA